MNARAKLILPWALFGVAVVAAIVFGVLWLQSTSQNQEADEVEEVSTQVALSLTNFSADTIEQDVAEIKQYAVGEFADEIGIFFGEEAVQAIQEANGVSRGEIDSIFVQEVDGEDASAFVVVAETVDNDRLGESRTDTIRMEITLVRTSNGWRANTVDILQSPGVTVPGGIGG